MAKKKLTISTSVVKDIHNDLEQKIYDYLVLYEYICQCDAWMIKETDSTIKLSGGIERKLSIAIEYLNNDRGKIAKKYFKKHSPIEKMTYYASIKKLNTLSLDFISLGMTEMQVAALTWNECPEKFLKVENPFNDFSLLGVNGKMYEFNGATQRAAVKYLYENTDENKTIKGRQWLAAVRSQAANPRDLFDHGNHDAWGTIIIQEPENSGKYRFYS